MNLGVGVLSLSTADTRTARVAKKLDSLSVFIIQVLSYDNRRLG
jgi:hypothetical protein